jgi:hypothetical protein
VKVELGEVLTRAWQITWKNKVLWAISALPILVSFLIFPIWLYMAFAGDFGPRGMPQTMLRVFENEGFIVLIILFYLVVIGTSIALQVVSRSSGTLGVYRAEMGIQPITFVDLIRDGFQYFLRILGISLFLALLVIVFFLLFFACTAVASIVTMGIGALCIQPLFFLIIPLSWLMMAVMEQAESAVVADGLGVMDALKRGYELVKSNLLTFGLILVVIYIGLGTVMSIFMVPFMVPMFFFMMRSIESTGVPDLNNFFRIQALFMVVLIPVMGVLQGIMLTYLKSAMMVAYLRLTRSSAAPQTVLQEVVTP